MFTECSMIVSQPYGHISSPDYPNKYKDDTECSVVLKAPIGNVLHLQVKLQFFKCYFISTWYPLPRFVLDK